ncbi:ribosomal protein S18-alanine N-acetyltransferase [Paracoccus fistulariae]|uniref:[Ribosomal protein bS18]-alanine N-acetyltransferase n=1 Tax=Paracoccus fistulariae TaxID=658446 RepID=A0ABY7SNW0_9RHOB|nr:ribosomal protein S18-alanine N-acetyltransferase [Paracoccus fistulariae]MDB6182337.1 ribosomal protein S18-alanine N-acetyltransferase [Paracoccus fistulariae]WCR08683.1 ribosomal protein S18-alanine N-acetyltransferase [Paracoccus fistulariae]
MTPAALARLHARCFSTPRPWNEAEFTDILSTTGTFLTHRPDGFLLGRVIADEAELLTIAVDPDARRSGTGRALVGDFLAEARTRGAATAFLEVASENTAALALYRATGWQQEGCRRNYYGPDLDAILMRLALKPAE